MQVRIHERSQKISFILNENMKGFLVSVLVAMAAKFLSEHYGAPAMLMALLLGMALNFLCDDPRTYVGIQFTARSVLRFGVALLGVRVSWEILLNLGPMIIIGVIFGVFLTIGFGILIARLMGRDNDLGLLTGGSVAICGASAAMAIAAVLPSRKGGDRDLTLTVLCVTVLSTLTMIIYPVLVKVLGFDADIAGIFLGASIHDVAQVVGAGFSISDETGEIAVLVKLIRVSMLAPVVLLLSLRVRQMFASKEGSRTQILPGFLLGFALLALLNSLGFIPEVLQTFLTEISGWALLVAIAAVGIKTSLRGIISVGGTAIVMLAAETLFLASFILGLVMLLQK
ncbi:YeiH family protein [Vreelandella arcis]|uniref:Conserved hypothetical integral membrane protein n=1 Tax=Vreelandella arcis TaxID=416873 RepID=A0A1H0BJL6_9GAMM|nr:putative sulfate exporter family transporter [Halomonas arcis]SDN45633.1 conserved hypothetical integral membrane protein [Halomonas arcis]